MFWRAFLAEQLALHRFQDAFQHLAALSRFRIGHVYSGNLEALLGIPLGVAGSYPQGRLRDESHSAPFQSRGAIRTPRPSPSEPPDCLPTVQHACTGSPPLLHPLSFAATAW